MDSGLLPTPISQSPSTPVKTIAFPNQVAQTLSKLSEDSKGVEDERRSKRSKRNVNGILSGEVGRLGSVAGSPGPAALGTTQDRAPEIETPPVKKGLSKKEQKRQENAKATEAQQHAATNSATNMALGGFGKKFSWMTTKNAPTNTAFASPPRLNSSSQVSKGAAAGAENPGNTIAGKGPGEFREDRETGSGIQIRDVVAVLELDMKEKQAMAKAFNRMAAKR